MTDLLQKTERKHTSIYVSVKLLDELKKAAKALKVSRNLLIEAALTEGLAAVLAKNRKRKDAK